MAFQAQKGTKDMLPQDAYKWDHIKDTFKGVCQGFGIREIATPIFEATELFERGVGETTDVVQKEMYTFNDKGGRSITLKPEGTAGAVRAFVESGMYGDAQPTKMFYITPVFRYENVQKGRLRVHHQLGVEIFGSDEASADAEVVAVALKTIARIGIKDVQLHINSIGHPECRKDYNVVLKDFLRPHLHELCSTCNDRFEKNPMRIIDCKVPACKAIVNSAPRMMEHICDDCREHFESFKQYLAACSIHYTIDTGIVRGLDYYSKTVFEIIKDEATICGGGRYDYLIEEIGGPHTPGVGFGMGIERILLQLERDSIVIPEPQRFDIFVGSMDKPSKLKAVEIVNDLRDLGIRAEADHMGRSLKAQMKYANKLAVTYTTALGSDELENGKITVKRMGDGTKMECSLNAGAIAELITKQEQ